MTPKHPPQGFSFGHLGDALSVGVKILEEVVVMETSLQNVGDSTDLPSITTHATGKHLRFTIHAEVIP